MQELLDHGADIDNKNEDEQTPFHLACMNGHKVKGIFGGLSYNFSS